MDRKTLQTIEKFYPAGLLDKEAALFIEVDGYLNSLDYQQDKVVELCKNNGAVDIQMSNTEEDAQRIWTARRSAFGAAAKLKPNVVAEDIVVPRENIAQLVEGVREICEKNHLLVCILGIS